MCELVQKKFDASSNPITESTESDGSMTYEKFTTWCEEVPDAALLGYTIATHLLHTAHRAHNQQLLIYVAIAD